MTVKLVHKIQAITKKSRSICLMLVIICWCLSFM